MAPETDGAAARPNLAAFLGSRVQVVVDRPMGAPHPRFPDGVPYPVNYGYLPGTTSGDGLRVDAYLLNCDGPLAAGALVEGVVVAAVVRQDDVEDKLIVMSVGRAVDGRLAAASLEREVSFQERYVDSSVAVRGGLGG